jgi:hypothetical protein
MGGLERLDDRPGLRDGERAAAGAHYQAMVACCKSGF